VLFADKKDLEELGTGTFEFLASKQAKRLAANYRISTTMFFQG